MPVIACIGASKNGQVVQRQRRHVGREPRGPPQGQATGDRRRDAGSARRSRNRPIPSARQGTAIEKLVKSGTANAGMVAKLAACQAAHQGWRAKASPSSTDGSPAVGARGARRRPRRDEDHEATIGEDRHELQRRQSRHSKRNTCCRPTSGSPWCSSAAKGTHLFDEDRQALSRLHLGHRRVRAGPRPCGTRRGRGGSGEDA